LSFDDDAEEFVNETIELLELGDGGGDDNSAVLWWYNFHPLCQSVCQFSSNKSRLSRRMKSLTVDDSGGDDDDGTCCCCCYLRRELSVMFHTVNL
jgi:hypothetical protein